MPNKDVHGHLACISRSDTLALWVSRDRRRAVRLRALGEGCSIEYSDQLLGRTDKVPFPIRDLRAVLLGKGTFAETEEASCAIGRWHKSVCIRVVAGSVVTCSIPVARYLVALAWLAMRLKAQGRLQARLLLR